MKTWVAMLGLCLLGLLLLAGCNKKENTNEEQGASPTSESKPSQTSAPIDQSTAAKVGGTVTYGGAAPKPAKIDMSQDAACKGNNQAETIVVDNGKLANVFVYVKDGLGNRSFDVPSDKETLDQLRTAIPPLTIFIPHRKITVSGTSPSPPMLLLLRKPSPAKRSCFQ